MGINKKQHDSPGKRTITVSGVVGVGLCALTSYTRDGLRAMLLLLLLPLGRVLSPDSLGRGVNDLVYSLHDW